MKDLSVKLTRATVDICFKSGDKIGNVVIERVVGNTIIANYGGKVTLIEIGHIAYVTAERGIMEIMKTVLSSRETTQKENKEDKKEN